MEPWEIEPNLGLGHIRFGMTPEQVGRFDAIYGSDPVIKHFGHSADSLLNDLGDFASFFSDEVLEGAQSSARELDAQTAGLIGETRLEKCYLGLEYDKNALSSISVKDDCADARFEDHRVFFEPAQQVLARFQSLNGGAKVFNDDVIFDRIGVLLSGFYEQNAKGTWRFGAHGPDSRGDRFVTLFAPSQRDKYLTSEFADVDFLTK